MKIDYSPFFNLRSLDKIYGVKVTGSNSLHAIKNESGFKELCELTDRSFIPSKNFSKKIFGNALPSSYEELGLLGKKEKVFYADSIETEINWTLLCIRRFKRQIALFNEYRRIYETAFLLGHYEEAERYLTKVETEICHSIWSLENRMVLLEFKESPEAHKTFLSDINKIAKGYFIPSLLHFISNRSERTLSVSRYDLDIQNTLHKQKGEFSKESREFYYFRLNRFEYKRYSALKEILTLEGYHSVIDRYLSLTCMCKIWLSSADVPAATKQYIMYRVKYLVKKFDDPDLRSLAYLHFPEQRKPKGDRLDMALMDLFTAGLYDECVTELKNKLIKFPSELEYYLLYVKSFLYGKKPFVLPSLEKCFQNTLLTAIYHQLNRNIDPYESMIGLQRIGKNLYGFRIANPLHKFINDEIVNQRYWTKYDLLSLDYNNPALLDYFQEEVEGKEYLDYLRRTNPASLAVQFYSLRYETDHDIRLLNLNIPSVMKEVERAKQYQKNARFDKAEETWKVVLSMAEHVVPIFEMAVKNLFIAYIELGKLDEAIQLYVTYVLKNTFLVTKIDVAKIHVQIRKQKFRNVTSSIDLPLFYTFSNADENELHIAYEKFNHSMGIERPSQLKPDMLKGDPQKWIVFLHQTCTPEIFKHSIYINGSKDRYSERIQVCQTLLELDEANSETYRAEINSLTDTIIIQEGLQQLDESKIYVNEQGLINSELREYEGLYTRFRTIANIYKESNKELLLIDKRRGVRLASVEDVADSLTKERYSSDPLRDSFADIFDVITRRFLFSKFGISAYLSTRIRHGVLLGEIRPIFEKFNLISQKDSSTNTYKEISVWNETYALFSTEGKHRLQTIFATFSESVDNIIHDLIKEHLQIKTEEENFNGWFDYYFDDTVLSLQAIKCRESKDYIDFVKKVIEILWVRTDQNLDEIRNRIQVEVKAKFNETIESLTTGLNIHFSKSVPELHTNITTCLTEIQNALDRIASWFNRSGRQTSDFKLDKLISIVLENISHNYPKRHLEIVTFSIADITIKGEFYMHFADLFRIFLDNALKHSDQNLDVIGTEINVEKQSGNLIATIKNAHPNAQNLSEIVDHSNVDLNMKKLSTEGKSGFPKADKIIRSDLKNEANSYKVFEDEKNQFTVQVNLAIDNLEA